MPPQSLIHYSHLGNALLHRNGGFVWATDLTLDGQESRGLKKYCVGNMRAVHDKIRQESNPSYYEVIRGREPVPVYADFDMAAATVGHQYSTAELQYAKAAGLHPTHLPQLEGPISPSVLQEGSAFLQEFTPKALQFLLELPIEPKILWSQASHCDKFSMHCVVLGHLMDCPMLGLKGLITDLSAALLVSETIVIYQASIIVVE